MATLSGNKIKDTYQSLVKFSDNGNITAGAKQLTDGFGNNSPMFVSTTQVGIGVTPEAGLNLHVFGDAKIGSNLTVIGNLVVEGSTTTVGTDTLTVKDPLIVLANNNTSTDAVDIGFYGKYTPSGTTLYSGLFREALTGKYRLFKGLEDEPTTTVNTSGTGYAKADLVIGNLETTQVDLRDDEKIRLGDNQELEIYHFNNDYSWIKHSGTEALFIQSDELNIRSNQGTENMITALYNGSVDLWYDGSKKLETTSTGISVTGIISNLTDPSAAQDAATKNYVDTQIGDNNELSEVLANGNTTGGTDIAVSANDDITFTSSSKLIFTGGVGIVNTALEMYHDGTDGYIKNDTGNLIIEQTTDDADIVFKNDNGSGDTIEYFRVDGSESRVVYGRSIHMADNVSIFLGNDDDGLIRYDSTADKILYTGTSQFSNDVNIQQNLTLPTSTAATIGRIKIGNGGEIQLYFDNTDSYLYNISSGDLNILSDQTVFIGNSAANETYAKFIQDGSVELYYNNSKKLQTTNTGVDITGNIDFTGNINIGDNQKILFGDSGDVEMFFNGSTFVIDDTVEVFGFDIDTNLIRFRGTDLYTEISNAQHTFWTNGTERFKINATEVKVSHQLNVTGDLIVDTDTLFVDASEDSVGIGLTNPSDYSADELVISVPDDSGMTLVSGTTDAAYIAFADATSQLNNYIGFDHDTDTMSINNFGGDINFSTGEAVTQMSIDYTGVTVQDDFKAGDLGDPYLLFADVSASTVYVEGTVNLSNNLLIGDDGFIGENVTVSNSLHIGCDTNDSLRFGHLIPVEGGYSSDLVIDSSGNATFAGDIMPSAENLYDIGSASVRWEDIWADQVYGRSVYVDDNIYHTGDTDTYIAFAADRQTYLAGGDEFIDFREATESYITLGNSNDTDTRMQGGAGYIFIQGSNGYIGINDATPSYPFEVNANTFIGGTLETSGNATFAGNVGIGTDSPDYTFTVFKSITNDWLALFGNTYNGAGNGVLIDAGNGSSGEILRLRDKDGNSKVSFLSNGNVGINASASLRFNGAGDNTHAVGYDSTVDGSFLRGQNGMRFLTGTGSGSEKMRITGGTGAGEGSTMINYTNSNIETYGSGAYSGKLIVKAHTTTPNAAITCLNGNVGGDNPVFINFVNEFVANQYNYLARIAAAPENTWTGTASTRNASLNFYTNNAGTSTERMRITSGGAIEIRNGGTNGGEIKLTGADNDLTINGARGQIKLQINGTNAYEVDSVQLYPSADNSKNLGTSSLRWSTVYAVNGINTSDETLKENIKECDLGIDFIDSLKPKSYNFKDLKEDNDAYGKKRYGLIAQDILQTELKDSVFGKKDGEYGLSYNDLIAPMIKAIQELKAEIELLKTQINN